MPIFFSRLATFVDGPGRGCGGLLRAALSLKTGMPRAWDPAGRPDVKPPGFSLIEVLVAMALAMLLVVGTGELIGLSLAAKRNGDIASGLAHVLAAKLEHLKSVPLDGPELEPGSYADDVLEESSRCVFVCRWEIEDTEEGMKTVRIRAHPRGRLRSGVSLIFYLYGPLGFGP
jgi:prepilin-type N-terminal cleavage/methylation domain-containing protein